MKPSEGRKADRTPDMWNSGLQPRISSWDRAAGNRVSLKVVSVNAGQLEAPVLDL